MADDLVGYGLPTLSRVAPPQPPVLKAAEPHRDETPEKNYGADINTLIRLLEEGTAVTPQTQPNPDTHDFQGLTRWESTSRFHNIKNFPFS